MNCPICDTPMIIDTWNGWTWTCFHCDHIGRQATFQEVSDFENETGFGQSLDNRNRSSGDPPAANN